MSDNTLTQTEATRTLEQLRARLDDLWRYL